MVEKREYCQCGEVKEYYLLNGALVSQEDIKSLPREWRLRLERMSAKSQWDQGYIAGSAGRGTNENRARA